MTSWLGLPQLASQHGAQLDRALGLVHVLMAVLFVGWGAFFAYVLVRFRRKRNPAADTTGVTSHTSTWLEVGVAVAEALLLVGFSMPLWADRVEHLPPPGESTRVRVVAEQFAWNVHYPGPDGLFGRTDPKLIDAAGEPPRPRPRATPRPRTTSPRSTSCTCPWTGPCSSSSRARTSSTPSRSRRCASSRT